MKTLEIKTFETSLGNWKIGINKDSWTIFFKQTTRILSQVTRSHATFHFVHYLFFFYNSSTILLSCNFLDETFNSFYAFPQFVSMFWLFCFARFNLGLFNWISCNTLFQRLFSFPLLPMSFSFNFSISILISSLFCADFSAFLSIDSRPLS